MKEAGLRGRIVHDFIHMECPEWVSADIESRLVVARAQGDQGGVAASASGGNENVPKVGVMVAQLKDTELYTSNGWLIWQGHCYISTKLFLKK